jgi:hypothetical protein
LYNTRYAIAVLPLGALAAGALITLLPVRFQGAGAVVLAVLVSLPMWRAPAICFTEAKVNSEVRRAWTIPAAADLAAEYRPGSGILFTFGSGFAEVLRRAGIPLRQGLHEGNGRPWKMAIEEPEKYLHEQWALALPGDTVSGALARAEAQGLHYQLQQQILVKGAPMAEIYHRQPIDSSVH